jgi:hypothetical protein
VAVMVIDFELLIEEGAVYNPFDKLPNEGGFMDQVTAVFPVLITVAVNCLVCEALRVAVKGLILTPIVTMAVS